MKSWVAVALLCVVVSVIAEESEKPKDKAKEELGTVIGIDLGTTYSWLFFISIII